jgi:hypothetical protein
MALSLCGLIGANTGVIDCDVTRGNPATILFGSAIFTSSDYASNTTLKTAFLDRMKRTTGDSQKLFALPVIQGVADKTVAAKYGTYGYGLETKLLRSRPAYEFDVLAGSQLETSLIKFDGKTVPVLIFDNQSQIWGKLDPNKNFIGCKCLVGVEPRPHGDANAAKSTKITISFVDGADFVENAAVFQSTFTSSDLVGLKDVYMSEPSAHASNVFKIKLKIKTNIINGDLDIYDDYAALIQPLTFTAFSGATFATSLPVTTVALDAANKALTVTLDSTAFTALSAGAQVKFVAPTPAVLDAAGVTGIEIGYYIMTK